MTEELAALLVLAFASTWTPGPNNLLLANSGTRFGFRRTLPLILGVALGFPFMVFCIALGLGELFQTQPWFRDGLRVVGIAFLGWICWRVAAAPFPGGEDEGQGAAAKPWRFWQAALFQWVNPKGWAMALTTVAIYAKGSALLQEALFCSLPFVAAACTSSPSWTLFGAFIRRFLGTPRRFRIYNLAMGALLAASGAYLFLTPNAAS